MLSLLATAGVMAATYYVGGPLTVWLKVGPAQLSYHFQTITGTEAPNQILRRARELEAVGYEHVAFLHEPSLRSHHALLVHRGWGIIALPSAMGGMAWTDLGSRFSDGSFVNTSDLHAAPTWDVHPRYRDFRFPAAGSMAQLSLLHRKRVGREGPSGAALLLPTPGTEIEAVAGGAAEVFGLQAELGNYRWTGKHFVLTPRGAVRMSSRLMHPMKELRTRTFEQRSAALMRELDRMAPPALSRPVQYRAHPFRASGAAAPA
ncbi:MAG TPA: hypothetical protein VF665_17710 [Longimicrobium sp.]|jgi:hypothetical protein|uniref:hypothetical protein n=1 Tax=Longimicrobium sp. TaxID=2029185 RepID=UPI002ED8E390